jgi:hypothetical protein
MKYPICFVCAILVIALVCGCALPSPTIQPDHRGNLTIASFSCDVTPPVGHPLCGGWIKPLAVVDAPQLAKGIVLSDGNTRYVLCAVDWCELRTGSYDLVRRKIASAADIPESQVAVQTVHPHDAPIADRNAQLLLERETSPPVHLDLKFMDEVGDRIAAAVREAVKQMRPFTHIGYGKAKVEKFASNRRVPLDSGKIHVRSSSMKDSFSHAAPEGLIDPWLRTITFFDRETPIVRLHYYASHPQSYYGKGRASPDVPGWARARLEQEEKIPHIYFTGCAGNVAAGKYNDGSDDARAQLIERLVAGMKEAIRATEKAPVSEISWKTTEVRFASRSEPEFAEAGFRRDIANPNAPPAKRLKAALVLAWYDRVRQRPGIDLSRLRLGPIYILHLPGEPFVEYQLYGQSRRPDDFVAVAGYGECGTSYICTDNAFAEGGYEPTESLVGPPSEQLLKTAIAELLR